MSKLLKRIGCFIGAMVIVSAVLFGILVFLSYRELQSTPVEQTSEKNFTQAPVVPSAQPTNVSSVTDDDPSFGPANARVTVVEFSDFECPFCKQAFPIVRELMVQYGDRVRFIYRDFPVTQVHDNAEKAAEAGACAHAQGKFWPLHDKIFQSAPAITVSDLKRYAREVGLDAPSFDACLDSGQFANEVQQDLADGIALGIRGTPTWFVNGHKIEGVIPRDMFVKLLDQLLAPQKR